MLLFAIAKATVIHASIRKVGGGGGSSGGSRGGGRGGGGGRGKGHSSSSSGTSNSGSDDEDFFFSCFPAQASVSINGLPLSMSSLAVGDVVRTGLKSTSAIFAFSHAELVGIYKFIRLSTRFGNLTASPGHVLHTRKGLRETRYVRPGDQLLHVKNGAVTVLKIEQVLQRGLFNPHTRDGNIVVDGFIATTFTDAVPVYIATSLLAPLRAIHALIGIDLSVGRISKDGVVRSTLLSVLGRFRRYNGFSQVLSRMRSSNRMIN